MTGGSLFVLTAASNNTSPFTIIILIYSFERLYIESA